jgi:hypothetical protein
LGGEFDIKKGQRLEVFREGVVNRPDGSILGRRVIIVGEIKITSVEESVAVGKITKVIKNPRTKEEHEIRPGDFVREAGKKFSMPFSD